MEYRKHQNDRFLGHIISTPFIWLPLIGFIILDILLSMYHYICFPLYGLEKVKRSDYIRIFDRAKLQYLSGIEKLGCMYCGYANGLLLYLKEIGSRTEKYWCGIMHENKPGFKAHKDQAEQHFARFNDPEDARKKYGPQ